MTRRLWSTCSRQVLLWLVVLWASAFGAAQAQPAAAPIELNTALATLSIDGVQSRYPVSLPYHWDRLHSGKQGWAEFAMEVELPGRPEVPWALFLPRIGNAFEVWLNDSLMHRSGDMEHFGGADFSKVPRYVSLPAGLHAGRNVLVVRIRTDIGRKGGVAALTLGPADVVYPLYYKAYRARGTGSLVVMIISLVMALAALTLWWTQVHTDEAGVSQRDAMYLVAAIGELGWAFRVGDAIVDNPPLPWVWWGALIVAAAALWAAGMGMFSAYAAGWRPRDRFPWVYPWIGVFIAAGVASSMLALGGTHAFVLTAWYAVMFVVFSSFLAWYSFTAVRQGSLHHQVVASVLLINVVVGIYDLVMLRLSDAYGANSLQRYSSVLFGVALGFIVFQRFRAASARARELTRTLEDRIAQKEQELAHSYGQMAELVRQQERSAERTRILRDMHDGVGVHLSAALRQVQCGAYNPPAVAGLLQEGLDQLKLSIDSLNLAPGDVTALLANLRYRLEPRLREAGLELHWLVDDIPPVSGLDDKAMRHLQFVVYGALANVLQHAQANRVTVQAQVLEHGVRLAVSDNGVGFDATAPWTRGLQAMRDRVSAIGGRLRVHSEPGHTLVEVLLH